MKKILACLITAVMLCTPAYGASLPVAELLFNTPVMSEAPKTSSKPENPENIVVNQKGISFLADFSNVPDYLSFAKLKPEDSVEHPLRSESFYYFESPENYFVLKSKIYDYYKNQRLDEYKNYLTALGFGKLNKITAELFEEYYSYIRTDLLYDTDFKLTDIYALDNQFEFTLVLFGKSVVGVNDKYTPCDEIRVYALSAVFDPEQTGYDVYESLSGIGSKAKAALANIQQAAGQSTFSLPNTSLYTAPYSSSSNKDAAADFAKWIEQMMSK